MLRGGEEEGRRGGEMGTLQAARHLRGPPLRGQGSVERGSADTLIVWFRDRERESSPSPDPDPPELNCPDLDGR